MNLLTIIITKKRKKNIGIEQILKINESNYIYLLHQEIVA
jgi:hypothetical protein